VPIRPLDLIERHRRESATEQIRKLETSMAVNQTFGAGGTSQDRRDSGKSDAYQGEISSQRHQSATPGHSDLRHDAEAAVHSAKETLGSVRDMAGDVYASAKKSATDAAGTFNDAVVRNPWASIGIAAGAGLLFGLLLNRLRS